MKHKYYDVIVAWAEGKAIQLRTSPKHDWAYVTSPSPSFDVDYEWRIKPVESWYPVYKNARDDLVLGQAFATQEKADKFGQDWAIRSGEFKFMYSIKLEIK